MQGYPVCTDELYREKTGQADIQGGPVRRGSTVHDFWITVYCVVVCFGFQDGDVSAYKFEVNA